MARRGVAVLVAALAATATLVAGCGSDAAALDPVAQAAEKTSAVDSFRVSMRGTTRSSAFPQPVAYTSEGGVDVTSKRASLRLDMSAFAEAANGQLGAASAWRGDQVVDFSRGAVLYMRLPFFRDALGTRKPWVKMDLGKILQREGIDLGQFTQLGQGDPTEMLRYLRATQGDVEEVGEEEVRGVATTRYRVVVDLRKYPELVPESEREAMRESIDRLIEVSGQATIPTEVWVDEEDHVRRLRMTMSQKAGNTAETVQTDMTIEYYDFGAPVDVALPPQGETVDLVELLEQQGATP